MRAERFGNASVQYNDWRGTAAGDTQDVEFDLYDAVGLDRHRWWIVGLEFYGASAGFTAGAVLAADRRKVANYDEAGQVARDHGGEIPVQRFQLSDEMVQTVTLSRVFKRWEVRLTYNPAIADRGIQLVEEGEAVDL